MNPQQHPYAFHFKLVGKIALAVAAVAALGIPVLLHVVTDAGGTSYGEIIGSRIRAEEQLGPTLWFFGLLLTALSGLATWFFALYGSFRVAGPLFRFSRNLEAVLAGSRPHLTPIRHADYLQDESRNLVAAVTRIEGHYQRLGQAAEALREALAMVPRDPARVAKALAALKEVEADVRL